MKNVMLLCVLVLLATFANESFGQAPNASSTIKDENQNPPDTYSTYKQNTNESTDRFKKPSARKKGSTEIELNYTEESLSNGYGSWRSASINFVHRFSRHRALYGRYAETERFRRRDREVQIGLYQPLNDKWTLLLEGNASPTHRILPKWSAMAQIERTIDKTWIVKGGYRRTNLNTAKANIVKTEVEKYWGSNRAAYALSINNLENVGTSPSHRIQYSRYYGERVNSFNVSTAFGRELESLGELGTLQSNIKNLSVSGRHWFKRSLGFSYGFTLHKQGDLYNRQGVNIGLRYKF